MKKGFNPDEIDLLFGHDQTDHDAARKVHHDTLKREHVEVLKAHKSEADSAGQSEVGYMSILREFDINISPDDKNAFKEQLSPVQRAEFEGFDHDFQEMVVIMSKVDQDKPGIINSVLTLTKRLPGVEELLAHLTVYLNLTNQADRINKYQHKLEEYA